MMAFFMAASPIAGLVGYPVSGAILDTLHGTLGLKGWQWLFLLEGLPSVLLGFVVLLFLPDGPRQARWLSPQERDWLADRIQQEEQSRPQRSESNLLLALIDWRVWLLIAIYFTVAIGSNAGGSNFPDLLKARFEGASYFQIGLLLTVPQGCAVLGMTLLGIHSDRTGERRGHLAFSAILAASGWGLCAVAPTPWLFLSGYCLAQTGMMSMLPIFWTLPSSFLSGAAAAGGIALINSVANVGGLLGPPLFGWLGLPAMALTMFAGGLLALCVRHD